MFLKVIGAYVIVAVVLGYLTLAGRVAWMTFCIRRTFFFLHHLYCRNLWRLREFWIQSVIKATLANCKAIAQRSSNFPSF